MIGLDHAKDGCTVGFFDIDGTLTQRAVDTGDAEAPPTQAVIDSVCGFVDAGNVALLCSGRDLGGVPSVVRGMPFSGMVGLTGSIVYLGEEIIHSSLLDPAVVEQLASEALALGADLMLSDERSTVLVPGRGENYFDVPVVAPDLRELDRLYPGLAFNKATLIGPDCDAMLGRSEALGRLEQFNAGGAAWEFTAPGVNKRTGARTLLDALPISPSLTFGIGDSANDLDLLEAVDVSVAMGNADDDVKACCDMVVAGPEADGVVEALRRLEARRR